MGAQVAGDGASLGLTQARSPLAAASHALGVASFSPAAGRVGAAVHATPVAVRTVHHRISALRQLRVTFADYRRSMTIAQGAAPTGKTYTTMIDFELIADAPAGPQKLKATSAQRALFERTALPLSTLVHGDYYLGLLDDLTVTARWHSQRRRFVCSLHVAGQPVLKAVPHVADLGTGARFAPIAPHEVTAGTHISDFALETTR